MRHKTPRAAPDCGTLSGFCLELSELLASGMILEEALALVSGGRSPYPWAEELADVMETERCGFSAAVDKSTVLPDYAKALIGSGERTGKLEEALRSLADWYGTQDLLEKKTRAALLRPLGMLLLILTVAGIIILEILPVFDQVYSGLGGHLSGPAAVLLAIGQSIKTNAGVILGIILGLILAAAVLWRMPKIKTKLAKTVLGIVSRTAAGKAVSTARIAGAMAMGLSSGLDMDETMALTVRTAGSSGTGQKAEDCRSLIASGHAFVAAIRTSGLLNTAQCRVLDLAMRSGSVDAAMSRIANRASAEAVSRIDAAVEKIEPAIVLLGAFLTGAVLFSVMLPMLDILTSLGV